MFVIYHRPLKENPIPPPSGLSTLLTPPLQTLSITYSPTEHTGTGKKKNHFAWHKSGLHIWNETQDSEGTDSIPLHPGKARHSCSCRTLLRNPQLGSSPIGGTAALGMCPGKTSHHNVWLWKPAGLTWERGRLQETASPLLNGWCAASIGLRPGTEAAV